MWNVCNSHGSLRHFNQNAGYLVHLRFRKFGVFLDKVEHLAGIQVDIVEQRIVRGEYEIGEVVPERDRVPRVVASAGPLVSHLKFSRRKTFFALAQYMVTVFSRQSVFKWRNLQSSMEWMDRRTRVGGGEGRQHLQICWLGVIVGSCFAFSWLASLRKVEQRTSMNEW